MIARFALRLLRETDLRLLYKFLHHFGWKGMRAVVKFKRRLRRGETFPAFLFLSITDECNLTCQGCWVTPCRPPRRLSLETMDGIVRATKRRGSFFFGILGGEPLLHPDLFTLMGRHPDAYFLLFTNGTLLDGEKAATLRRLGNVSPLISIEGREKVSDERRGGRDVYRRALSAVKACQEHRLIMGVSTSICRSNIEELATRSFVDDMAGMGVHYLWYNIYRPVGPDPSPELALSTDQIEGLRRFIVDVRLRAPMLIVDSYWDAEGRALCPAAVGIAHHIGPGGDIEPCPPIQFACEKAGAGGGLDEAFERSAYLAGFRVLACKVTRGCVLLERPDLLAELVARHGAADTSGRQVGTRELAGLSSRPSHDLGDRAIPEKHWLYRFAKRHWFFGFGAYG